MRYSPAQLSAYLERIGIGAVKGEGLRLLETVLRAHRLTIPFENLDIPLGRGIDLAPARLFDKLVTGRRGGYCFEQNGFFLAMLRALGFEGRPLLARVWLLADDVPPRTHTMSLVRIGGEDVIADAGFGGSYMPPMPLIEGRDETGPDGVRHRFTTDPEHGWVLERDGGAGWARQYSFTLDPVWPADLEAANHWTATRPGTRFTSLCIASTALADGFVSLVDRTLTVRRAEESRTEEVGDIPAYRDALRRHFRIELGEVEVAQLNLFPAR